MVLRVRDKRSDQTYQRNESAFQTPFQWTKAEFQRKETNSDRGDTLSKIKPPQSRFSSQFMAIITTANPHFKNNYFR